MKNQDPKGLDEQRIFVRRILETGTQTEVAKLHQLLKDPELNPEIRTMVLKEMALCDMEADSRNLLVDLGGKPQAIHKNKAIKDLETRERMDSIVDHLIKNK